jgi:hypothetical protein
MRALTESTLAQQIRSKLERALPHRTSGLSKRELRLQVEAAVSRARAFGFGDDQLLAYAAFEIVFGAGFGGDPRYPWAKRILENKSTSAADRMQALREAGIFHLAAVAEEAEWAEQQEKNESERTAE